MMICHLLMVICRSYVELPEATSCYIHIWAICIHLPGPIARYRIQPVRVPTNFTQLPYFRGWQMSLFGAFEHHLHIFVGYYIPNSRVMFNWDIYQPL